MKKIYYIEKTLQKVNVLFVFVLLGYLAQYSCLWTQEPWRYFKLELLQR